MKALIDSGAATSIIAADVFHKFDPSIVKQIANEGISLRGFSGQLSKSLGRYMIKMRIDNNYMFEQGFYVVPFMQEQCILGLDFLYQQGFIVDGRNRRISFERNGKKISLIAQIAATITEKPETTVIETELEHLPEDAKMKIQQLLSNNKDIFAQSDHDLGKYDAIEHTIWLEDSKKPIYVPHYRTPFQERPLMWEHIVKLLENKVIRTSTSPYGSPVMLVPKKGGETRFVVDFRRLNASTQKDRYPLPRIDETIEALYGAQYFTTLDLMSGYHQIAVAESDKAKTAFTSEFGHYEFNRLPFGLCNAPATFQRVMNEVLRSTQFKSTMVYLDDIIVFSKTMGQHLKDIQQVFTLLRRANLKLKMKKCAFCRSEVEYLGHIVSKQGIKCDPKKLLAIEKYPVPKDANHVRSFLGLANYYRRFVNNFAEIAHPLTELTGKKMKFKWTETEENAFILLKKSLTSPPILRYPDFTREFIIHTDASGYGVGAILGQVQKKGNIEEEEVVIAYYSKHLTETQRSWCVTEREAYAIMLAVRTFRPYLYGRKFTVFTDHKPLEWLMNLKTPNGRLLRWSLEIQEYDIVIGYKPGKTHQNADCLSRVPVNQISVTQEWKEMQKEDPFCKFVNSTIETANSSFNQVVENLQARTATAAEESSKTTTAEGDGKPTKTKSTRKRFMLLPGDLVGM